MTICYRCWLFLTFFKTVLDDFWRLLTVLTIWRFLTDFFLSFQLFSTVLTVFDFFFFTVLTVFDRCGPFDNFWPFLTVLTKLTVLAVMDRFWPFLIVAWKGWNRPKHAWTGLNRLEQTWTGSPRLSKAWSGISRLVWRFGLYLVKEGALRGSWGGLNKALYHKHCCFYEWIPLLFKLIPRPWLVCFVFASASAGDLSPACWPLFPLQDQRPSRSPGMCVGIRLDRENSPEES